MNTAKTPSIKAVAFDLDGLMVNTEDIYDVVLTEVLSNRGHEFTLDLKLAMMGRTANDAFSILKSRLNIVDSFAVLHDEVATIYVQQLSESLKPMPGLLTLFQILDRQNIPRAVTTSSPKLMAHATLAKAGIQEGFVFVLTGDDVVKGKPDPEIYEKAIQRFNISAANMLVLEDSFNGSMAGSKSGAFTVAVPGSHSQNQDFSHVDLVADSLDDESVTGLFRNS